MPRWTDEARAKQRDAIRRWSPWANSTGPRSPQGKAVVARNAYKGDKRGKLKVIRRELRVIMKELDEIWCSLTLRPEHLDATVSFCVPEDNESSEKRI